MSTELKMSPDELENWLEKQDLSNQQFADALGITPNAVDHWLRGRRDVPATVVKLTKLFDVYPQLIGIMRSLK